MAGTITVAIALAVAIFFSQDARRDGLASAGYGFWYGLWPIAWIIIAAWVFPSRLYRQDRPVRSSSARPWSPLPMTSALMLLVGFFFGPSLKGRLASVPRWPSPPPCWWAWASTPSGAAGLCL
nr:L-lactate permease [Zoogloea sp.]